MDPISFDAVARVAREAISADTFVALLSKDTSRGEPPADQGSLRVLKVTQSYYPFLYSGGPAVKVRAIARGLTSRGHHVTVLTTDFGVQKVAAPGELTRSPWGWQSGRDGVESFYLKPRARYRALTWNPGVFGFCRERLPSFDVVHIYGMYDLIAPPLARACCRLGIPYVVEPMGMFRPIVRNIALKRLYLRLLGHGMARGAQRIVATAPQEQQELIEEGVPAEKIVVRRNGIEPPERLPARGAFREKWRISPDALLVLYLGRLVTKKSPELLIEAFAHWKAGSASGGAAILVLAGPDPADGYRQQLEALAGRLGLGSQVLFTGPLYDDAKWSAFRDADLFVLPSQNENFGNTAAEAVACETPVVVTDRCGVAPFIDGRAGMVIPHDREALAAAFERILDDASFHRQLQSGCAQVARELSWSEPLAETELLYRSLLQESRRH
jgi:glycosyltransferase involved in cell wall biosynthesis